MAPSHLRVEHSPAGYRRLLLSRPERRNALDVGLARALRDALRQDRAAPVVLGSTDPRVFCAGADLTIPDADRATVSDLLYECYEIMITRPGPVIAVVSRAGGWRRGAARGRGRPADRGPGGAAALDRAGLPRPGRRGRGCWPTWPAGAGQWSWP